MVVSGKTASSRTFTDKIFYVTFWCFQTHIILDQGFPYNLGRLGQGTTRRGGYAGRSRGLSKKRVQKISQKYYQMNEINLCDNVKDSQMCGMSGVDFRKIVIQGVKSKKSDFLKNKMLPTLNSKSVSLIPQRMLF